LALALPPGASAQHVGPEFRVNSYTTGSQSLPAAASAADGNFVVVWDSVFQDGSGLGVFGQLFASDGTRLGAEFPVPAVAAGNRRRPSLAREPTGAFVAAWHAQPSDGDLYGIESRRFDAGGVPEGAGFSVKSHTTGAQVRPAVAATTAGNFVVVWQSNLQDGFSYGVFGQRLRTELIFRDGFQSD
jgi:hypothetical protein